MGKSGKQHSTQNLPLKKILLFTWLFTMFYLVNYKEASSLFHILRSSYKNELLDMRRLGNWWIHCWEALHGKDFLKSCIFLKMLLENRWARWLLKSQLKVYIPIFSKNYLWHIYESFCSHPYSSCVPLTSRAQPYFFMIKLCVFSSRNRL